MIRLFVSDIDGCIAEPYAAYDLDRLRRLAERAAVPLHGDDPQPALSLCSGRAYAYVEALTQTLGVQAPVLFESGGGLFDLPTASIRWHPHFTADVEAQLADVRAWLIRDVVPGTSASFDYGKRTQAGVISPDPALIERLVPVVEARVAEHYPELVAFHTPVSIDVLAARITKREGLAWLAEETGVPLDAMAYIGDTNGDLPALEAVGWAFAPANATERVRTSGATVTEGAVLAGVLEAYDACTARNARRGVEAA